MKEVHMICNAHLDPIWQWEWEEGAAAALSTFRAAADLCDEFAYVFCHNEVTLYKYIEEYAPALFERIKKLVRAGKWHIMGGWYLQPDCNMPTGESFIRQIAMGHRYFREKFGVEPTTAINFDPFGHTAGLPQIMKKCGQDSYIICRPGNDPIPNDQFVWEGLDGSRVKVDAAPSYNSPLGGAAKNIEAKADRSDHDTVCVLWGVGNHGGGPSRKDLADIEELKKEGKFELIHSTPEYFFGKIDPQIVHKKSLRTVMPGCYTTMVRIKQKHAELENAIYTTETMCSVAAQRGLIAYPEKDLDEAVEDLLNAEFHDILPGSSVRAGEDNGIRLLEHGLLLCSRLRARAYFAMSAAEPKAKEGEYPILVFNPHPYLWETEIICEFSLADQNWNEDNIAHFTVLDADGNPVPWQMVKEESNLNLDWRKRLVIRGKLAPLAVSRFSVYVTFAPKEKPAAFDSKKIVLDIPGKYAEIDRTTGLLTSYRLNGKEYVLGSGAFLPVMYEDNADPWGMGAFQLQGMGRNPKPFTLEAEPAGMFSGMKPVQIIEDGDIYLGVEAFFVCEHTRIRVEYDIYKTSPCIDVKVDVSAGDANRMIKLEIPSAIPGAYVGQTAFGTEPLYEDGRECIAQRFVAVQGEDDCLAIFNRGTYASSFRDGVISLSLMRTATYCAHPIMERPLLPEGRFIKKIDMGERNFAFRMTAAPIDALERLADEFNRPPYAYNVFPVENDAVIPAFSLSVDDENITLVTMKKQYGKENTYVIRLLSNSAEEKTAALTVGGTSLPLNFGKYEAKTVLYDGKTLTESPAFLI
ncbi:MAG: alpha-mannosidase [Clostridia bacterium]|nr:alpha-mannosidase [Clostridia bacterium]